MRTTIVLALGAIQVGVGVFIALRPLTGPPLTSTRVLDMAFAAFFLIRGIMNMRTSLRARRAAAHPAPPPPPNP